MYPDVLFFLLFMIPGTVFIGVYDVLSRKALKGGDVAEGQLLGVVFFLGGALLLLPLAFIGIPELKSGFWFAFAVTVSLNALSQLIWLKAFKLEEASLVSPFRLLTPPLVILTGFLVLGELPSFVGVVGLLAIVFGLSFLLKSQALFRKINFREFVARPGILFSLVGAVLFAISFPYDKLAVQLSSALFFSFASLIIIGCFHVASARFYYKSNFSGIFLLKKQVLALAVVYVAGILLTLHALNFSLAAYASGVKRLSVLWTIILGGAFLREGDIKNKMVAAVLMLAGVFLILFA